MKCGKDKQIRTLTKKSFIPARNTLGHRMWNETSSRAPSPSYSLHTSRTRESSAMAGGGERWIRWS